MIVQQISVFLENKSYALSKLTTLLSNNNINLLALCISESNEFGIIRIIVDDVELTKQILEENGYAVSLTNVVVVTVKDEPGALTKILQTLNGVGIDIEYMYAFMAGKMEGYAKMIIKTNDIYLAHESIKNLLY